MIAGTDLDHVAVALEQWDDARPRYVDELGGLWVGGMPESGFAWAQIIYANGMRLELLEPHEPERNDFLRRFLDRNGPGPHHITFKVPDLLKALAEAEAAGYRPVGVNIAHPDWKEAFLHPKDGPGVVIQLAESHGDWESEQPARAEAGAASLDRITHAVADLDEGLRLFEGLLGGTTVDAGGDSSARWVEVGWPGPGRVRLIAPTSPSSPVAEWLGTRTGRIHHLGLSTAAVDAPLEITPQDNCGVRLLLTPA